MTITPSSSRYLTLPSIHSQWTTALNQPPTTRLAPLRRLINAIGKHGQNHGAPHGESTVIPRQHLALLWLDLSLTHAFLGDYWLAIKAADPALVRDPSCAIGYFVRGLAKAELGLWRKAGKDFKRCLGCFEGEGARVEEIRYKVFPRQAISGTGLGEEWVLEWTRVEWNFRVTLLEGGSRTQPQPPRLESQKRQGLNGIPAGVHMGPRWDSYLQLFHPSEFSVVERPYQEPLRPSSTEEESSSSHSTATLGHYSAKPLPPIPSSPLTIPLPTVRVFSYSATPTELKHPPHSSTPSPPPGQQQSLTPHANHHTKELWTPFMPPRSSLKSPLTPYFPDSNFNQNRANTETDESNNGNSTPSEQQQHHSTSPHHTRHYSIDDIIAEWVADSDDFDGSLAQARESVYDSADGGEGSIHHHHPLTKEDDDDETPANTLKAHWYVDSASESDRTGGPGGDSCECKTREADWVAAALPTPIIPARPWPENVNERGEEILLPKAFPGFKADEERRMREWNAKFGDFPGKVFS